MASIRIVSLLLLSLVACSSPTPMCSATSCPEGCCDASGACRVPTKSNCGVAGATCSTCRANQFCGSGACTDMDGGGVAGGGSAGGSSGGGTVAGGAAGGANAAGGSTSGGSSGGSVAGGSTSGGSAGGSSVAGGSTSGGAGGGSSTACQLGTTGFFVSPTGDDTTGDGSSTLPWRSVGKAARTVTTRGAIINVRSGTYVEPATIDLAPGVSLLGQGDTTVIKSTLTAQYVPLLRLASAEGTNGGQVVACFKLDGDALRTSWGLTIAGRSNVDVHHLTVVDFQETGVNFSGITNATGSTRPATFATGNRFHDNVVTNCSTQDGVFGRGCLQFGGQDGMQVYRNTITQPARTQGTVSNVGWPIKMANEGHIKNCRVYENTLTRAPFIGINQQGNWNFAFEMWNVENLEMDHNVIQGAVDFATVGRGSGAVGLNFHHNVVQQPALNPYIEDGLRLETDEADIIVDSNEFRNLSQGVIFSPHDYRSVDAGIDIERITISRNLFSNVGVLNGIGHSAIRFEGSESNPVTRVSGVRVVNNTFVAAAAPSGTYFAVSGIHYTGVNRDIVLQNNIFRGFQYKTVAFGAGYQGAMATVTNLVVQNNDFFGNGIDDVTFTNNANQVVCTATGYVKTGNLNVDPLFVSATDFHLQPSSPLVNAGVDAGLPFSGSAPDLGCFER